MYCLWWTCPPVSLRQFLLLLSSSSSSPASSSSTFSFLPIIRLVTPVTLVIQVAPNLNNISGSRFNHVDLSRTNGPCCCRFSSSVRSSYSHPDLLLTHHPTPPHFFRAHRSSTLDFHFLSLYSYIKAIMLYKGNHWTRCAGFMVASWV